MLFARNNMKTKNCRNSRFKNKTRNQIYEYFLKKSEEIVVLDQPSRANNGNEFHIVLD